MNKLIYIEIRDKETGGNRIATEFELAEPYIHALHPLNRNREIPFDLRAQEDAKNQQLLRAQVTKIVAERFNSLLEKQDPQNGYSPSNA